MSLKESLAMTQGLGPSSPGLSFQMGTVPSEGCRVMIPKMHTLPGLVLGVSGLLITHSPVGCLFHHTRFL